MRLLLLSLFFVSSYFFPVSSVFSHEITEIVTEHFPPYQIQKGDGVEGISIDIVNKLHKRLHIEKPINVYPWARAYKIALSKPNTLIFSMTYTQQRRGLFQWIGFLPILDEISFWTLNSVKREGPLNWANVQGLTSAIPRQDSNLPLLLSKGLIINSNLYLVNSFEQAIDMLVKERVDYIVAGKSSLRYQILTLGYSLAEFNVEPTRTLTKQRLGFAFNLESEQALVEKYRVAFKAMEKDGSLNDIMTKWLY